MEGLLFNDQIAAALLDCRLRILGLEDSSQMPKDARSELASLIDVVDRLVQEPYLPLPDGVWAHIPDADGFIVSDQAEVAVRRGGKWITVSSKPSDAGYHYVSVGGRNRQLSHVVLESFIGPRQPGMLACHFPDRDTSNNKLSNLRWDTAQANADDKVIHEAIDAGITGETAAQAYRMFTECRMTIEQIAKFFRISTSQTRSLIADSAGSRLCDIQEIDEENSSISKRSLAGVALGRLGGAKGGVARSKALSTERKIEIGRLGAEARWRKKQEI